MAFKILVAEDEEITLKHLLSTLQKEEYEVTGFNNGRKAFERIEEEHFDLLIADIKMPGLTGIELLEKIKEKNIRNRGDNHNRLRQHRFRCRSHKKRRI